MSDYAEPTEGYVLDDIGVAFDHIGELHVTVKKLEYRLAALEEFIETFVRPAVGLDG